MVVGPPADGSRGAAGRSAPMHAPSPRRRAALGLSWVAASGCRSPLPLLHLLPPEALWAASRRVLVDAGLAPAAAARFFERRAACPLSAMVASLEQAGEVETMFVAFGDPGYPEELLQLPAPPAGIFVVGRRDAWERLGSVPRVTIVGTRRASGYGVQVVDRVAHVFAQAGVAVLSGLALGIDGRAHQGALRAGGLTAAVVGNGTEVVYPRRHRDLRRRIVAEGAVLGELPPGTPPSPWTFPLRNRLLAALGDAVIVAEAGLRSGALITVEVAAELGRPVFAVPGPILGDAYVGCNRLLYDGATPLLDPEQALEDFLRLTRMERGARRATLTPAGGAVRGAADLGSVERLVLLALERGPLSIDQLAPTVGADVGEVSRALALLELRAWVARSGPGCYRRT